MRFAFETARSRPRKKLTVVTKSNAQRNGMVFWDKVASEVAKDFPDVEVDKMLVDAVREFFSCDVHKWNILADYI